MNLSECFATIFVTDKQYIVEVYFLQDYIDIIPNLFLKLTVAT